jgi:hypothetical protein
MGGEVSEAEGDETPLPDELPADAPEAEAPETPEAQPAETPEVTPQPAPEPAKDKEELEKEVLGHQINAMRKMSDQLDDIKASQQALDAKLSELNTDVEEVREPTNVEKLANKKMDSHPYYYGLNDMWSDNWFQARNDEFSGKEPEPEMRGIKKLEDGSYIADFDELPKFTDKEINDSLKM